MPDPTPQSILLTPQQAAALLNISAGKVYELIRQGHLPAVKLPGCVSVRIRRERLEQWILEQETISET